MEKSTEQIDKLNYYLYVKDELDKVNSSGSSLIKDKIRIYTVIPYFSNGYEVNQSDVKSFTDFKKAEEYTWTLNYHFDVIENELIDKEKNNE
jgi:hypothetical protein